MAAALKRQHLRAKAGSARCMRVGNLKGLAMAGTNAYEKPLSVEVYEGEVVLRTSEGPFCASLTAEAAAKTAQDLAEAARAALSHQASQEATSRD
jgi:hypothetical protein